MTDDVIAFLRARLDEDAAPTAVPAWHANWCIDSTPPDRKGECGYCGEPEDPTNVEWVPAPQKTLADVDAKRRIIDLAQRELDAHPTTRSWDYDSEVAVARNGAWEDVLPLLALPYSDHPDYREEWRP